MFVVGLTGGIGVGKSTAGTFLSDMGAYIIDSDEISRSCVSKGNKTLDEIVDSFGRGVLDKNEELNRKVVADIVFSNPEKLDVLSNIVHKKVFEIMKDKIEKISNEDSNAIVVVEIPIPTKQFVGLFNEVWVVDSTLQNRVRRIILRDNCSKEQAMARINSQLPQEEYVKMANHVVINNGSKIELKQKLADLIQLIKEDILFD